MLLEQMGFSQEEIIEARRNADSLLKQASEDAGVSTELEDLLTKMSLDAGQAFRNVGESLATAGLATLGYAAANTAVDQGRKLINSIGSRQRKEIAFNNMLAVNDGLAEADPGKVELAFNTLHNLNPEYASDPLVASEFVQQVIDMRRLPIQTVNELVRARESLARSSGQSSMIIQPGMADIAFGKGNPRVRQEQEALRPRPTDDSKNKDSRGKNSRPGPKEKKSSVVSTVKNIAKGLGDTATLKKVREGRKLQKTLGDTSGLARDVQAAYGKRLVSEGRKDAGKLYGAASIGAGGAFQYYRRAKSKEKKSSVYDLVQKNLAQPKTAGVLSGAKKAVRGVANAATFKDIRTGLNARRRGNTYARSDHQRLHPRKSSDSWSATSQNLKDSGNEKIRQGVLRSGALYGGVAGAGAAAYQRHKKKSQEKQSSFLSAPPKTAGVLSGTKKVLKGVRNAATFRDIREGLNAKRLGHLYSKPRVQEIITNAKDLAEPMKQYGREKIRRGAARSGALYGGVAVGGAAAYQRKKKRKK